MPLVAHPASKGGHGGRDLLWSSIVSRRKLSLEAERTNDLPVDITERVIPEHFSWGSSLQRAQLRRGHAVPVAPVARPQGVDGGGVSTSRSMRILHSKVDAISAPAAHSIKGARKRVAKMPPHRAPGRIKTARQEQLDDWREGVDHGAIVEF